MIWLCHRHTGTK